MVPVSVDLAVYCATVQLYGECYRLVARAARAAHVTLSTSSLFFASLRFIVELASTGSATILRYQVGGLLEAGKTVELFDLSEGS